MCGEQGGGNSMVNEIIGSPPRVRGTDPPAPLAVRVTGITPACAGNSSTSGGGATTSTDHPRVCGEQSFATSAAPIIDGSPPRVRGTVCPVSSGLKCGRITPACAGNSSNYVGIAGGAGDHPRVCGEQTKKNPSFLHSFLSDQENSFSLKYNCSISSQSFCARWTSLQGSSKCFAKVDS